MKSLHILTIAFIFISLLTLAEGNDKLSANAVNEDLNTKQALTMAEFITIPTNTNTSGAGVLFRSASPTNNWLLIYHDRWGITEDVIKDAHSLWKDLNNVNVLIVDLNDGVIPNNQNEALRLLITTDLERTKSIINGAILFTGPNSNIANLGWCNGGAWALQSAMEAKNNNIACVMYYGMPEFNTTKLKALSSDVFTINATMDTYITPTIRNSFDKSMQKAGKKLIQNTFNCAGNFANRKSRNYNEQMANYAYYQTLSYLKSKY